MTKWYVLDETLRCAQGELVDIWYDPKLPTDFMIPQEQNLTLTIWPTLRKAGIVLMIVSVLLFTAAMLSF